MRKAHITRAITTGFTWSTALLTVWVFLAQLSAQTHPKVTFAPVEKGMVLPDVERTEFHSNVTGRDYTVYVSLPASYSNDDQRYPVSYVPDIDEEFLCLKGASRIMSFSKLSGSDDQLEDFILVGVPLKWKLEDPLLWIEGEFVATSLGCFDDDTKHLLII